MSKESCPDCGSTIGASRAYVLKLEDALRRIAERWDEYGEGASWIAREALYGPAEWGAKND